MQGEVKKNPHVRIVETEYYKKNSKDIYAYIYEINELSGNAPQGIKYNHNKSHPGKDSRYPWRKKFL